MGFVLAKVKVRFFAWLREEVGLSHLTLSNVEFLADVLASLSEILRDKQNSFLDDRQKLKSGILIALNNRIVNPSQDLSRIRLCDGDVIDFLPLGSGG